MTQTLVDEGLRVHKARDVLVVPSSKGSQGGLIADGVPASSLLLHRGGRQLFEAPVARAAAEFVDEPCIFAGWILGHFGHFLLEGLSRVWHIRESPGPKIVWLNKGHRITYNSVQSQIMDLLGIANEPLFVITPTHFSRMEIPSPGYQLPHAFEHDQARALAVVQGRSPLAGKRVWLSRSNLGERGGFVNERETEEALKTRGWTIFHPEEHSIRDQIEMLCDAEHISGIEGSAFHTLIFIDRPPATVTVIGRREAISPNLMTIAKTKGLNQRSLVVPFEILESEGDAQSNTTRSNFRRLNMPEKRKALGLARWSSDNAVADALDEMS
jgi:capsular polysaccharide biosynthesis protein